MPLYESGKIPESYTVSRAAAPAWGASWALWKISESEEELLSKLDSVCFSREELAQIRVPQRKLEWLACRLALQSLLTEMEGVQLQKNERGRPYLQPSSGHVSLSHAYPFAAAVVHPRRAVGLDLEQPRQQLLRIKQKFLSPQEQAWVGENVEKLCLCWTAKEALYKMNGEPGLVFSRDILLEPAAVGGGVDAWLKGEPYALHYTKHDQVLMCVAIGNQETKTKAGTDFDR